MKTKFLKLFDDVSKNIRGLKIMTQHEPMFFFYSTSKCVLEALGPYVNIFIAAMLIEELAGERNPGRLFALTLVILAVDAVISLVKGMLVRRCDIYNDGLWADQMRIMADKMKILDFPDVDSKYAIRLAAKMEHAANWANWGLMRTVDIYDKSITAFLRIITGIALGASLFTKLVPSGHEFEVLNHKAFILLILGFMLLISILSPACGAKADKYWADLGEKIILGNRAFSYYCFLSEDDKRAADMRLYGQEKIAEYYYDKYFSLSRDTKFSARWRFLEGAISMVLTGIIYLFVCLKAWAGAFGIGAVTQYIGAATNTFMGIKDFFAAVTMMRTNAGYLDTVFEFMDIPNKMYQGSLTTEKRVDRKYEVEFRDVSFKYPESEQYSLRHVNMKFKVGEKLAVVGMNGSGKTTFIKLLCRLYDPTEGEILLNGINIKKYRYDEYMDIFSVVFQDFNLFSRPLDENVAGSMNPDEERVTSCLKDAGFELDETKMTKGLKTWLYKNIDKEGVEISGGEAQKIAIARALYKDAPFIILDEPTAALDPIAEAEIYEKFNDIVGDKTAVYISHRLSSCKFCDEIAVFHEGTVIQKGTHEELLQDTAGKYYELWNAQAKYYNEKRDCA